MTYHELHHGPLVALVSTTYSIVILMIVVVALRRQRQKTTQEQSQARLVRLGISLFLFGALNDIAVSRLQLPIQILDGGDSSSGSSST